MSTLRETKVSLAVVLAISALMLGTIATAAGTAVAGPYVAKQITKSQVKKVAKKQIKKQAPKLVRATSKTLVGESTLTSPNFSNRVSTTIVAPTKGILVISASAGFNRLNGDPNEAHVGIRSAVDGEPATIVVTGRNNTTTGTNASLSVTGAIAVTAGTHTVSLQAAEFETGSAFLGLRTITAMFVPYGATGQLGDLPAQPLEERSGNR